MELCFLPTAARRRSASALVLVFVVALSLIGDFRSDAQVLPEEEVQVLREVGRKMGIRRWNLTALSVNSCRGYISEDLTVIRNLSDLRVAVACNCSFNNSTICHVTHILLPSQELHGELPEEFANLTYLSELDIGGNYFNGTISRRFASLPLVNLYLLGNLIEGTILREFGDIATLENLDLSENKIGGPLPEELGNLSNLRTLYLRRRKKLGQRQRISEKTSRIGASFGDLAVQHGPSIGPGHRARTGSNSPHDSSKISNFQRPTRTADPVRAGSNPVRANKPGP